MNILPPDITVYVNITVQPMSQ